METSIADAVSTDVAQAIDLVRIYLNDIARTSLLDAAQEVELAKKIEAGLYAKHLLGMGGDRVGRECVRASSAGG